MWIICLNPHYDPQMQVLCNAHLKDIQEVGDLCEIIQLLSVEFGYKFREANLKACAINFYFILSGRKISSRF